MAVAPAARKGQHLVRRARVEHVPGLEPRFAADADADFNVVQSAGRMCIGPDLDRYAAGPRGAELPPIEVETVRVRVELHRGADVARLVEHGLDVERVRRTRKQ